MVFSGIENQGFAAIRTGPQHNHIFQCVCGNEWLGCVDGPGWAVPRAGYTVCKNECQYPHPLCVSDSTNLSSLWRFLWNKSVVWSKRAKHSAEQRSGLCRYKSNRWAEVGQEQGNIHRQQTARTALVLCWQWRFWPLLWFPWHLQPFLISIYVPLFSHISYQSEASKRLQ